MHNIKGHHDEEFKQLEKSESKQKRYHTSAFCLVLE